MSESQDDDAVAEHLSSFDDHLVEGAEVPSDLSNAPRHLRPRLHQLCYIVQSLDQAGREAGRAFAAGDLPSRIGRFQVIEEIGQGGFGIVLRALDPILGREVALKIPRLGSLITQDLLARFESESRAAASLDHPNIVPVHEFNNDGIICYMVSAYCRGPNLAMWLRREARPVPIRLAAKIVSVLARAIDHAHRREVIHRDVKPSNVLLDPDRSEADEFPYVLKIVDFGLAKLKSTGHGKTATSMQMGSANYMSPEQAAGRSKDVGPGTDIYSLGVVLYELLVGHPPLVGESDIDTLQRVQTESPPSPRRIRPAIARDLEVICLKCLAKQPTERYVTAEDLADDLQRYLQGQAIRARPTPKAIRAWRWSNRHPAVAILVGIAGFLAVAGPLAAVRQSQLVRETRAAREETRRLLYASDMNRALHDWEDANLGGIGPLLDRHRPSDGQTDYRGFEWYLLNRAWRDSNQNTVLNMTAPIQDFALSPDESIVAIGSQDRSIRLYDARTWQELGDLKGHFADIRSVAFSPDGTRLVSTAGDGSVRLWDLETKQEISRMDDPRVWPSAFAPNDRHVAVGLSENRIGIWDLETNEMRSLTGHASLVTRLAFAPNGQLASSSLDGTIKIWDVATATSLATLEGHGAAVWCLDYSPDGSLLASGDVEDTVMLWDVNSHSTLGSFVGHANTIQSVSFAADGKTLASASSDNTVKLWNLESGMETATLAGHASSVIQVAFVGDADAVLSAGTDGEVRRWPTRKTATPDLLPHPRSVTAIEFTPDGRVIASGDGDGVIRLWDVATGRQLAALSEHRQTISALRAFVLDGTPHLVSLADDGVLLWDLTQERVVQRWDSRGDDSGVLTVHVGDDGARIAFSSPELGRVNVWDSGSQQLTELPILRLFDLAFSPAGELLAFCTDAGEIELADSRTGKKLNSFEAHFGNLYCITFSPDGTRLVSAGDDRTLKLWDVNQLKLGQPVQPLRVLAGHSGPVRTVVFTPDGTTLASVGEDRVVRLWDVADGTQRGVLRGQTEMAEALTFSPDGQILASCGLNGVRLWRAPRSP